PITNAGRFALKVLKDQSSPERRARMLQEVTNLRLLEHPNVARHVDSNAEAFKEEIELYLVTEFVEGHELQAPNPLSLDDACRCLQSLLKTLEYCHGRNVVHRDLKPSNIIL